MKRVSLVTDSQVDIDNYISGQEYYLSKLKGVLENEGYTVELVTYNDFIKKVKKAKIKPELVHAYYLNFKQLAALKFTLTDSSIIYHVYHVKDDTWSFLQVLSWKVFLAYSQFFVTAYLATSLSVNHWLNKKIFTAKVTMVEPFYECACGFSKKHDYLSDKFGESATIRLLYVGRLHSLRFSLDATIKALLLNPSKKKIELTVVSLNKTRENFDQKQLKANNIELNIINKRLSEKKKCGLYTWAQFFLYPALGNVAMNPPITLLEAVYHGALPIVFSDTIKDLDIPSELRINDICELSALIEKLTANPSLASALYSELLVSMHRFFDKQRFLGELTRYRLA